MTADDDAKAVNESAQEVIFQKIYVGDASLEVPSAPGIFDREWDPEVDVQIQNSVEGLSDGMNQVVLSITVTAKLDGEVAYLAEVHQCGVFTITGYDEATTHAILGSYCPSVLFPFARESISDLVQRGGFPQLLLQPVDFEALYREHMEQNGAMGDAPADTRH